jgi:hypothetical protein
MVSLIECLHGPVSTLSDTAILAASRTRGDYGACRFWACLAWGVAGVMASVVMSHLGDFAIFSG